MLTENTVTKLQEMRLSAMASPFKEQMTDPNMAGVPFEDRFSLIVDHEWTTRKNCQCTTAPLRVFSLRRQHCSAICDEGVQLLTARVFNRGAIFNSSCILNFLGYFIIQVYCYQEFMKMEYFMAMNE